MVGSFCRTTSILVASLVAVCVLSNFGMTSSEAQINPTHGLPKPPPRVPLPAECTQSPANIINEIEQGIDQIPNCGARPRLGRAVCCAAATTLSESGCEKVLDTAMRCCRLRFPLWTPPRMVDYLCNQAMYQYGISDASEHCWRTREKRLEKVGCIRVPSTKRPESAGAEESL